MNAIEKLIADLAGRNGLAQLVSVASRLLMAFIFIMAGWSKIGGFEGTQQYMQSVGVPGGLLPLVIVVELGGGLLLLAGLFTRATAAVLAGFCVISGILFHFHPADQMQMIMFMKNLAMAGGLLQFVINGAGAASLDRRLA